MRCQRVRNGCALDVEHEESVLLDLLQLDQHFSRRIGLARHPRAKQAPLHRGRLLHHMVDVTADKPRETRSTTRVSWPSSAGVSSGIFSAIQGVGSLRVGRRRLLGRETEQLQC